VEVAVVTPTSLTPDLRGFGAGDQVVEVAVVTPTSLTERQCALLREFADIEKEKKGGGFFRKLFRHSQISKKKKKEEASFVNCLGDPKYMDTPVRRRRLDKGFSFSPEQEGSSPYGGRKSKSQAHMVDVSPKPLTQREAVASGRIIIGPDALNLLIESKISKGDVLAVARIAGIMAAE